MSETKNCKIVGNIEIEYSFHKKGSDEYATERYTIEEIEKGLDFEGCAIISRKVIATVVES